jgi:hypothetical protein
MKFIKFLIVFSLVAFTHVSQSNGQQPNYIAHEWGTFTSLCGSDGVQLNGLYKEEEALPSFVHSISSPEYYCNFPNIENILLDDKGFGGEVSLIKANVKMETPVIYFYAGQQLDIDVNVWFKKGLISQYYPNGDLNGTIKDVVSYLPNRHLCIDFSSPQSNNSISWKTRVLTGPNSYTGTEGVTNTWATPRNTDANMVQVGNESEKFLFYRGVGNFEMPIKISFDDEAKLVIKNNYSEAIPYVFIYDKAESGEIKIWWTGNISSSETKVVSQGSKILSENEFKNKLTEFQSALSKAGLYDKESAAMLNTWKESYFEKNGLRVFWIVPASYTSSILPLKLTPSAESLQRVLVGRSEIMKPDFEKKLFEIYKQNKTLGQYWNNRFEFAYKERMEQLEKDDAELKKVLAKAEAFTNPGSIAKNNPFPEKINVFPNPASFGFSVSIENPGTEAKILLTDITGKVLQTIAVQNLSEGYFQKNIDISNLSYGLYLVQVQTATQKYVGRLVKE